MKKLVLMLCVMLISVMIKAQCVDTMPSKSTYQYVPVKHPEANAWKTIGMYTASVTLNAIGDGLNDRGNKGWGHACNALSIDTLLVHPFVCDVNKKDWYKYLITYTSIRLALFDPIYNTARGVPLGYIGYSSMTDRFQQKFGRIGVFPERTMFLAIAISVPLNQFR